MPPVMRLHLIGAVFCDGRGQIGLTHRRSCAFDGRAVACLSYSPFRWLSTHLPSRDAAHDALHLIGAFFLNGRGRVELDAPTFLCFRRTCGGAIFLLPFSVANYSPVRCCVNIYVHSLCRAAGVLEWQESGGRARASCSQRCAATGRVRCVRCRRRDGGYLSRSYSDVARASGASSRCSFRASPFGLCSSPVPALLSRCFCDTAT